MGAFIEVILWEMYKWSGNRDGLFPLPDSDLDSNSDIDSCTLQDMGKESESDWEISHDTEDCLGCIFFNAGGKCPNGKCLDGGRPAARVLWASWLLMSLVVERGSFSDKNKLNKYAFQ